jgi:dolichol-phosphate mannosyltransferase
MSRAATPMMPTGAPAHVALRSGRGRVEAARVLVVLPTYCELASLPFVIEHVLAAVPHAHLLVIDDDSPDGTGVWAEERTRTEPQLSVLHRARRLGAGSAYRQGLAWGLACGFDVLCTMVGDARRDPTELPTLLAAIAAGADVAIAGRIDEQTDGGIRRANRRFLESACRTLAHHGVGQPLRDITSPFRAYRARLLRRLDLCSVAASGDALHVEMLWRAARAGGRLVECPVPASRRGRRRTAGWREVVIAVAALARLRSSAWQPTSGRPVMAVLP